MTSTDSNLKGLGDFFGKFKSVSFRIPVVQGRRYQDERQGLTQALDPKLLNDLHAIPASVNLYRSPIGISREISKIQSAANENKLRASQLTDLLQYLESFIRVINENKLSSKIPSDCKEGILLASGSMPKIVEENTEQGQRLTRMFGIGEVPGYTFIQYRNNPKEIHLRDGSYGDSVLQYTVKVGTDNNIETLKLEGCTLRSGHGGINTDEEAFIEFKANPDNPNELFIDTGAN